MSEHFWIDLPGPCDVCDEEREAQLAEDNKEYYERQNDEQQGK